MKNPSKTSRLLKALSQKIDRISRECVNLSLFILLKRVKLQNARKIETHMTQRELNTLYIIVQQLDIPGYALEIGSYLGASSCYLAAALILRKGHLFCIDTWENQTMPEGAQDTLLKFKENIEVASKYITIVRKDSKNLEASDIGQPLNFVFIDGNHSYEYVKNDYRKVSSLIVPGGILAFHDCVHFEGVSRTIGEALATGDWQICGQLDNLIWLRKMTKGIYDFAQSN